MKRNIIRVALIIVLIALGVGLYVLGRNHKIFIDNKDIVLANVQYRSENTFSVFIDGNEAVEVGKGKRKVVYSPGPWHTIRAIEKLPDGTTREIIRKFSLASRDTAIINLPVLASGNDGWLSIEGE